MIPSLRAFNLPEKYIQVSGNRIRFVEKGKGSPIILIHGLGASLEWWQFNIDMLSAGYRIIALDFLGFGLSSKPSTAFSLNLASEFMRSFLDVLELARASLVGNSLGGLIALYAASRMPDRVDKLVLVDNAGLGQKLSILLRLGSVYPVGELALSLRNRLTVKMFLSRLVYDSKKLPPQLIDCVLRMFSLPQSAEACLQVLRTGVNLKGIKEEIWRSLQKAASSLPHETLIVWGAEDRITPLNQAHAGKGLIRNSRLHVIESCGHIPQVECPEEFNQAVLDFLKL
jgi:4,5:9,10-diseco-3-hydroxy-5,9,17-trioxoandrosta-1(10),2-diene-4-oate hydrolase